MSKQKTEKIGRDHVQLFQEMGVGKNEEVVLTLVGKWTSQDEDENVVREDLLSVCRNETEKRIAQVMWEMQYNVFSNPLPFNMVVTKDKRIPMLYTFYIKWNDDLLNGIPETVLQVLLQKLRGMGFTPNWIKGTGRAVAIDFKDAEGYSQ